MNRLLPLLLIPFTLFAAYDPDNPKVDFCCECILSNVTASQTESAGGAGKVLVPPTSIEDSEPVMISKDKTGMYHLTIHVPTSTSEACTQPPAVKLTDKGGHEWIAVGTTVNFDLVAREVILPICVQVYCSGGSLCRIGYLDAECRGCEHACAAGGDLQGDVSDRGLHSDAGAFQGDFGIGASDNGDTSSRLKFNIPATQAFSLSDLMIHSNGGYSVSGSGPIDYITDSSVTTLSSVTGGVQVKQYAVVGGTPQTSSFRTINFQNLSGNTLKATVIDDVHNKSFVHEWRHPNPTTWEYVYGNGLRKKIVTRTTLTPTTRSERHQVYERNHSETGEVTADATHRISDVEITYTLYGVQWQKTKEVIDPTGTALTSVWTYYANNDISDPLAVSGSGPYAGEGRVSSFSSYDASTVYYFYSTNASREERDFMSFPVTYKIERIFTPATNTYLLRETKLGTETKKSEVAFAGNVETQKNYYDTSGFLTTTTSYMPPGSDFGGDPVKVTQPDLTIATYTYARTSTEKTITVREGAGTSSVTSGTQTITKTNASGTLLTQITTAISSGSGNGIVLSSRKNHTIDALGRPTLVYYFPDASGANPKWTESTAYSCCGISSSTDRHGIVTTYTYDDLKRQTSSTSLGVSSATQYNGLTTISLRGGQVIGKQVNNLARTIVKSYSPSPQTGALPADATPSSTVTTTYKNPHSGSPNSLPAGIGSKSVTTLIQVSDDGSIVPTETILYYFDGSKKFITSNMGQSLYMVGNPLDRTSYLRNPPFNPDGTGGSLKEASYISFDMLGRTITSRSPSNSSRSIFYYNSLGQLYLSRDADGYFTCYSYNSQGQQTITAVKRSAGTSITYGTDRIQYSETTPALRGSIPVLRTISKVWQTGDTNANNGTVVSTVDRTPDGLQSWQESIGVAQPATSVTTLLGAGSWTEKSTAPDGTYSLTTYTDGKWDKTEQFDNTNALLHTSSVNRDAGGTIIGYDAYNRLTQTKDSRTGVTTTTYKSAISDAVIAVQPPAGAAQTTSYTYDHRGRQITVDAPDTDDPNNTADFTNITTTQYYVDGSVKDVNGGPSYHVSYTYDYAGRRLTMTTYGSQTTKTYWKYNSRGLLEEKGYDYNESTGTYTAGPKYTYTAGGRLRTREWARNVSAGVRLKTTYTYTYGRLTLADYNDTTPDVSYTYDTLDRPLTVTQANQSQIEYTYNNLLQLDKETAKYDIDRNGTYEFTRVLDRSIDSLGRSDGYTLGTPGPGSVTEQSVTYGYSTTNGRFGSVTDGTHTFTYGYTANSNLIGSVVGPAHTVTNTPETTRNVLLTKSNTRNSNNTVISSIDYTVNTIGQRTNATRSGASTNSTAWQYDVLGQVTQADDTNSTADRAYLYDGIGNRKKSADSLTLPGSDNYTANALNQYTAIPLAPAAPIYDEDGNMTSGPLPISPTSTSTLAWDAENRMIEVKNSSATTIQQNIYDAFSRKIATTAGGATTLMIYDGWNPIAEYTGSTPTLTKTNLWGLDLSGDMQGAGGVGGLLSTTDHSSSPTSHFPLFDGNGNITEYIDSSATVVAHYEYDPFGNATVATGAKANDFTHRFSTKPLDPITGLYYYGYRYYDPNLGRWISRDPIGERGGLNLYGFVNNDGICNIDILGLQIDKKFEQGNGKIGFTYFDIKKNDETCTITLEILINFKWDLPFSTGLVNNILKDNKLGREWVNNHRENQKKFDEEREDFYIKVNEAVTQKWNNFRLCCEKCKCEDGYEINVIIIDSEKGKRVKVFRQNLVRDLYRSNQLEWNLDDRGSVGEIAVHEIGHFLGNHDEYNGTYKEEERDKGQGDLGKTQNIMNDPNKNVEAKHFYELPQNINMTNCRVIPKTQKCQ